MARCILSPWSGRNAHGRQGRGQAKGVTGLLRRFDEGLPEPELAVASGRSHDDLAALLRAGAGV